MFQPYTVKQLYKLMLYYTLQFWTLQMFLKNWVCKVLVTCLNRDLPNRRYASWRMPCAHSPNGIPRDFKITRIRMCERQKTKH